DPKRAATRPVVLEPVTTRPVAPVLPKPDVPALSFTPVITVAQVIPDAPILPKLDVAVTAANTAIKVLFEPVTPESTRFHPALPPVKKKAPSKKRVRFASPPVKLITQTRDGGVKKPQFMNSQSMAELERQIVGHCKSSKDT